MQFILLEMSARKCEKYLALETMITEVSSQIAISRNVQLGLQSHRARRRDVFFSSICAYLCWRLSLTFRPFLNLDLCLMNSLNPLPVAASLHLIRSRWLNLISAWRELQSRDLKVSET
jgi:hypothetical protein